MAATEPKLKEEAKNEATPTALFLHNNSDTWICCWENGACAPLALKNGRWRIYGTDYQLQDTNPVSFCWSDGTVQEVESYYGETIVWRTDNMRYPHIFWKHLTVPKRIRVAGAGSPAANGIYILTSEFDIPKGLPDDVGPLLWRQENPASDLSIIYTDNCWWIADYHDATADYYIIDSANKAVPPIGRDAGWIPCSEDDDGAWHIGVRPIPNVEDVLVVASIELRRIALSLRPEFEACRSCLATFLDMGGQLQHAAVRMLRAALARPLSTHLLCCQRIICRDHVALRSTVATLSKHTQCHKMPSLSLDLTPERIAAATKTFRDMACRAATEDDRRFLRAMGWMHGSLLARLKNVHLAVLSYAFPIGFLRRTAC